MATDWRGRVRPLVAAAGWIWLALVLAWCARAGVLWWQELGRIRPVGAATIFDRASQLKPWPYKAPLSLVWLAAFLVVLAACVLTAWGVAVRRAARR